MVNADLLRWREPVQARSRKRVSILLETARALSMRDGLAALKMSDVAAEASVPIGSLYQFFPTRTALIARLYAEEMVEIDARLVEALERAQTLKEVSKGVEALLRETMDMVSARPWLSSVLNAPAADPAIEDADLQNTHANAARLAERLARLAHGAAATQVNATALILCHLWAPMIRLCLADPDQADAVLAEYAAMVAGHLERL